MRLNRVRLKNICQHRDRDTEFDPGLNAILGPNGSGKSNFVNSIYAGLTNDFSRFSGNKFDQISQYAKDKEKSFIDIELQHEGNQLHLRRSLIPSSKYLTIDDGPKITSEKGIAEALQTITGISNKLLDSYVFVDQWQIFAFLLQTESERAKALQHLFGTDKLEICWNALGKEISQLTIPVSLVNEDSIKARLFKNETALADLDKQLKAAEVKFYKYDIEILEDELTKIREIKAKRIRLKKLQEQWTVLYTEKVNIEQQLNKDINARVDVVRKEVQTKQSEYNWARNTLNEWKKYKSYAVKLTKLDNELTKVYTELAKPFTKSPDDLITTQDEQDAVFNRCDELRATLSNCEHLAKLNIEENSSCPLCGQKIVDVLHILEEHKTLIPKLEIELETLIGRIDRTNDYVQYLQLAESKHDSLLQLKDQLLEQLEAMHEIMPPNVDEKRLLEICNNYTEFENIYQGLITEQSTLNSDLSSIAGKIKLIKQSYVELKKEIADCGNVDKDKEQITLNALNDYKAMDKLLSTLTAKFEALDDVAKSDSELLKDIQATKNKAARVSNVITKLESVRTILHRDCLPRDVAKICIVKLLDDLNDILESFDSPFRAKTTDNLGFRAVFFDGRDVPAEALSGGEKAIFAIAFRIVINSKFAGEAGLLCLDEPTAGLDKKNIGCLTVALDRLRYLSKSRGLQCLLITHEESLMPYFDKVIEL